MCVLGGIEWRKLCVLYGIKRRNLCALTEYRVVIYMYCKSHSFVILMNCRLLRRATYVYFAV